MADILITGKTEIFTREALLPLAEEYRVILAGRLTLRKSCPMCRFTIRILRRKSFGQLFDVYSFQAVYFVSGYVDGGGGTVRGGPEAGTDSSGVQPLKVEKLVLLSTVESQNYVKNYGKSGIVTGKDYPNGYSFRAAQMEELCTYFAKKMKVQTVILWAALSRRQAQ